MITHNVLKVMRENMTIAQSNKTNMYRQQNNVDMYTLNKVNPSKNQKEYKKNNNSTIK